MTYFAPVEHGAASGRAADLVAQVQKSLRLDPEHDESHRDQLLQRYGSRGQRLAGRLTVTMLVAGVRTFGGKVETLEVDEPRPLAADEVLIEVRSAGIGNWDNIIRTGGWDVGRGAAGARRRGCRGH